MLKFVTGTAGTGKSEYILNEIASLAAKGEKCILIVPEQFSKTGESLLFTKLNNENINRDNVQLHSFTSLKVEIENNYGRFSPDTLSKAGRAVMARRAMMRTKNLDVYKKHTDSVSFAYTLAGTFEDLKRSGFTPEHFRDIINQSSQKMPKLNEISILYREYNGLMGDKFCDEEDIYCRIAENMPEEYVMNRNIFIDGFEHFSYGQLQIIKRWLEGAKAVSVGLVCDTIQDYTSGTGTFSYVQETAQRLISIARTCECEVKKPISLKDSLRFKNNDLRIVDRYLRDSSDDSDVICEGKVYVNLYLSQTEEVMRTVAEIRKLVSSHESPMSYSDIAIVCPQLEKYEHQLQESLSLADMPYFIDEGRIISSSAPVILFGCLMQILSDGITADTIMPLLHTQLTDTDPDDVSLMENYLFLWQDADIDFSKPFTLPVVWEGKNERITSPEDKENLERINLVRSRIYSVLCELTDSTTEIGAEIINNVYEAAQKLGAVRCMNKIKDRMYSDEEKRLIVRQWAVSIDCLDMLYKIVGKENISPATLYDLFNLMISGTTLDFSPETQDCIIISEPKRMKLDSVRAVFILGAAQEIFPSIVSSQGLITDQDREFLDIRLDSDFREQSSFEVLYFYKALTTAREYLYISVAEKNIDTKQVLSAEIEDMKNRLNIPRISHTLTDFALTEDFFADFIANISDSEERKNGKELLRYLGYPLMETDKKNYVISDRATLKTLLQRNKYGEMWISPSNAEDYYTCPFMFFLNKVLKIRPLEKARFNRAISGNYLHRIVELVIKKYGENFYLQNEEQIDFDIEEAIEQFITESYPPEIRENVKFNSQYKNLRENAKEFMHHILAEQKQGLFRPVAFEQKINIPKKDENPDEFLHPVKITTDDGNTVVIYGTIDRVDVYRGVEKDYLRIVDYKTGTKEFKEDAIASGLSSQLLVYMKALMENDFAREEKEIVPGAVLYQRSEMRPVRDDESKELYLAVGMALEDKEITKAFGNRTSNNFGVISGTEKITKAEGSVSVTREEFESVLNYVTDEIKKMGDRTFKGNFYARPFAERTGQPGQGCSYCRFKAICQRAELTEDTNTPPDKNIIYTKGGSHNE